MFSILTMNRITLAVLLFMISVIAYDSLRTPVYMQRLEASGYKPDKETLQRLNPPVTGEDNAEPLLYKAYLQRQVPEIEKLPVLSLYNTHILPTEYWSFRSYPEDDLVSLTEPYTEEQQKALRLYVEQNIETLRTIYASTERKSLQFRSDVFFWEIWQGPEYSYYMLNDRVYAELCRLVAADGMDALLDGDQARVIDCITHLIQLTRLFSARPEDRAYMAFLSRFNISAYTTTLILSLVENVLNRMEMPHEQLYYWKETCKTSSLFPSDTLINVMLCHSIRWFTEQTKHHSPASIISWDPLYISLQLSGVNSRSFKLSAAQIAEDILKLKQVSSEEILDLYNYLVSIRDIREYTLYSRVNYYSDISAIRAYLRIDFFTGLVRTGIALYLYGQEHGAFPDTLEALVPEYLDAVPVNPFTRDEPLQYRHEDDRVVLSIEQYDWSFTLLKSILPKGPAVTTQEQSS